MSLAQGLWFLALLPFNIAQGTNCTVAPTLIPLPEADIPSQRAALVQFYADVRQSQLAKYQALLEKYSAPVLRAMKPALTLLSPQPLPVTCTPHTLAVVPSGVKHHLATTAADTRGSMGHWTGGLSYKCQYHWDCWNPCTSNRGSRKQYYLWPEAGSSACQTYCIHQTMVSGSLPASKLISKYMGSP